MGVVLNEGLASRSNLPHNPPMGPELLVILASVGALAAGVVGSMAAASRGGAGRTKREDAVERAWRAAAEALDGELVVDHAGGLSPRRLSLRAEIDGILVQADSAIPVEPTIPGTTHVGAAYALGSGPRFQLAPLLSGAEGRRARATEAALKLGRRGLCLTTPEPEAVRVAFDGVVASRLREFPRPPYLRSDGRGVSLEWDGVERDATVVARGLRLVGRLAGAGMDALRALAEMEGASLRATADGPEVYVQRGGGAVEIVVESGPDGPRYGARAKLQREVSTFEVTIDGDGVISGDMPPAVIAAEQAARLGRVGPALLRCDGAVAHLTWEGTPSTANGTEAVTLLTAVAVGDGKRGAFR